MTSSARWQFWIDRGGTFTDIVARRPDGTLVVHKLLSENPERYRDAAVQGMRDLLGVPQGAPLPRADIDVIRMGTTVGTNALLTRTGEPTLLAITQGFRDQLRIAYQNRPDIFALHIELPDRLYADAIEIDERMGAHGEEVRGVDEAAARAALEAAYARGYRSVAVVFMHGYRYPGHEKTVARLARDVGFTQVTASHEVGALMKLVSRGETTVLDAYLSPLLRRYVAQVAAETGGTPLMFMQSNGGLAPAQSFAGRDSILSGPAGGIVGAVKTCRAAGFDKVIGFDMGGTSTDVSHYCGEYERSFETEVAGVRIRTPMLHIHTVAAGGGSILHFDGARLRAGPDSAGANPGPAAYRRGGPLTVTDANVMLGKIRPEFFPRVFGVNGDEPLDRTAVERRFTALAQQIGSSTGTAHSPEEVAEGFIHVAVENMANAIRKISVQRGIDVTDYTLCCFGGAGAQHACLVADRLGLSRVFLHPLAGVLSAYGIGLAEQRSIRQGAVEAELAPDLLPRLESLLEELAEEARSALACHGMASQDVRIVQQAHLRYAGTDTALVVEFGALEAMTAAFTDAYRTRYGFSAPGRALIVESVSAEAIGAAEAAREQGIVMHGMAATDDTAAAGTVRFFSGGTWIEAPALRREALRPDTEVIGPALIVEAISTIVVEPGWSARLLPAGQLVLTRVAAARRRQLATDRPDPVMLEVFANRFMAIAEEMGVTLQNAASSVNIKERLDFSCALFDAATGLIANAPHMPVHLGSMGESVKSVRRRFGQDMHPGDVYLVNSPYHGGTHLPDITVVTPVFDDAGEEVVFYTASRGHHADVGGITPGSMPPGSRRIDEEGAWTEGLRIVQAQRFDEDAVRAWLGAAEYPARNPTQNVADLRAQIAANAKGVLELRRLVEEFSLPVVQAYMGFVQDNAEAAVRRVIEALSDGEFAYAMDSGAEIRVKVSVDRVRRCARIDFTGTSAQQPDNFNAPAAVAKAAVLYVFRTLVQETIPLNEGCLRPLELVIPEGSMLNPAYPAAVVAGNVETSQYIVDALYGALGVLAAAQGTMNNFTFGNERHQYYETICGGAGAGPDFDGTSAVHTHMTNSRLTDPEVLEWRFPVRLERFEMRPGSGGAGRHPGGDGVVRRVRFLEPMTAAILSDHRKAPNFGLAGGSAGALGKNSVVRNDGSEEILPGTASVQMQPGDSFVIETPGGGGFGTP